MTESLAAAHLSPKKIMFSAGESSGDQHAANMFLEMQRQHPEIQAIGMGMSNMAAAGIELAYDSSKIAVIGLVEIIKHYREIRQALTLMQKLVLSEKPDLLVCVDYQKFNLQLAQFAKRHGFKVLFCISPQIWASRPGRIKAYGQAIDMMAVIFPFETALYAAENVPVRYVGHPSVDRVKPFYSKAENRQRFALNAQQPLVGLFPGSRNNEIRYLLPVMLEAAALLYAQDASLQFILPQADSITDEQLQGYLAQSSLNIKVIKHEPYEVMQCCDVIMSTSGTATLEIALLNIPLVITYKLSSLTYYVARWLINTPFIGLPNIIAGKAIVKELIQQDATAPKLAAEVQRILGDQDYAAQMRTELQAVQQLLGQGGGSKNMADLALEMLGLC